MHFSYSQHHSVVCDLIQWLYLLHRQTEKHFLSHIPLLSSVLSHIIISSTRNRSFNTSSLSRYW